MQPIPEVNSHNKSIQDTTSCSDDVLLKLCNQDIESNPNSNDVFLPSPKTNIPQQGSYAIDIDVQLVGRSSKTKRSPT